MRTSSSLFRQFFVLSGILGVVVFSEVCFAEQAVTRLLESRYQQEKRKSDLLQRQQQQNSIIKLQQQVGEVEFSDELSPEKPCFVVDKVKLVGEQAESFAFALESLLFQEPEIISKCLGVKGINTVISKVQNQIIRAGYVTTRVLAEPQDLNSGELKLTLIPGIIGEIRASNESTSQWLLNSAMPLQVGELLNIRDIEQGIENLTRVPTVIAEVDIVPAEASSNAPGFSDLVIHQSQSRPYRVTLSVDDSGYDATGRYQGVATVSLDNPLELSDLFYVSLNTDLGDAKHGGGTDGYSVHYSLPLGYWLLSATTNEYEYWQSVAGLNQSYEYSGKSHRHGVEVSRVVYRDSRSKLKLGLQAYKTSSRNFIENTEIEVQHRRMSGWIAELNYQIFLKQAAIDLGVFYQRGTGAFDTLSAPEAAFDEGTSRPKIFNAKLSINYPFKLGNHEFNFSSDWEAQWNKTTLVPNDRFSIGGRYTVRGFDGEMTLLAERGWFSRNTLSMGLGNRQHQIYSGIDFGHVSGQSADLLLGQSLVGWVLGIKGHWKGFIYDLFAGTPLAKPDGFQAGRTMGFSLIYQY